MGQVSLSDFGQGSRVANLLYNSKIFKLENKFIKAIYHINIAKNSDKTNGQTTTPQLKTNFFITTDFA